MDTGYSQSELESNVRAVQDRIKALETELEKVVIGQKKMINRLLIGLFANGHILLEGVPGLAKTLTVSSLAQVLDLSFKRVQFTPDLLPADLIGTLIYNQKEASFEVKKGPIFANIVLADEINRSPAKVQSALLEAMQEKQVTIGENTFLLDMPFLVMATQNPVEQEGTYPLPEAQVDRFMMKVHVSYPTKAEEREIMRRMARTSKPDPLRRMMSKEEIFHIREMVAGIKIDARLEEYIVDLVFSTRDPKSYNMDKVSQYLEFGASPRAGIALHLGARVHALMQGRTFVLPEDVKEIANDILNHRVILNYEAEADEVTSSQVVEKILRTVPLP